jgi:hypothetical protein
VRLSEASEQRRTAKEATEVRSHGRVALGHIDTLLLHAQRHHERAHRRKTDDLRGIKENVIMGRLIPAGTGLPAYKKLQVVIDEKSPTYAPPTFTRVQPADLVAVGDE